MMNFENTIAGCGATSSAKSGGKIYYVRTHVDIFYYLNRINKALNLAFMKHERKKLLHSPKIFAHYIT